MGRSLSLPLAFVLGCLVCAAGCDEDDPPGSGGAAGASGFGASNGSGSTTGGVKDDYPTVGCGSLKDDVRSCTTTHGPLTQEQIDNVANGCIADGNTLYRDESCARSLEQGCCISGAAGTRVTTCFAGPNVDSALAKSQCLSAAGYWSTAIGDNPPSNGTGAAGSGTGSAGSSAGGKFIAACYQAAAFQCTGYTITNAQLDDSCKQGGGVVSTSCPSQGLRGCCLTGGYAAICYYEGGNQTGDKTMEAFCKEGGNGYSATAP